MTTAPVSRTKHPMLIVIGVLFLFLIAYFACACVSSIVSDGRLKATEMAKPQASEATRVTLLMATFHPTSTPFPTDAPRPTATLAAVQTPAPETPP